MQCRVHATGKKRRCREAFSVEFCELRKEIQLCHVNCCAVLRTSIPFEGDIEGPEDADRRN